MRLSGVHRDPKLEPLLHELAERHPADARSHAPAARVVKSGTPLVLADIDEEFLHANAVDQRHAELIRRVGTRSAVVVPLIVRDTTLGALTLSSSSPGRFRPADVELAVELGRRAALAIDNARLLRETRRAVQLRDDFLSVASHELRTPMTSLMLTVQYMLQSRAAGGICPEALGRNLDRIRHSAERLQRLGDQLLDVTRIERGRLDIEPVKLELGALVRQVVEDLKFELKRAGCPVELELGEPAWGS